ncbi:glycosyltransferase [Luteolibacter flavescens]|uniref:Glycosyltransferase n=1 Tax=Luteolibacter flavescens TaxID=1859460 RepID=A0ABT3FQZ2_9BACT|nr:glycosyltransferase [Luteolibacter flavescens]MCW1886002.1 glycosyltransferase [Luteolibacter flavescens]
MKIAMFTNTYLPHVGGVARSVQTLEEACRARGHEVRVIAPEFSGAEPSPHVLRVPAIQNFNGSDFCVRLPMPSIVRDFLDDFQPDLIHSHHPFLLGDSALREGWKMKVPVVFTHHTLYERYTHYVPLDSDALKRMAVQLATDYCNLCDAVIAPSESIADLLADRGVTTPIHAIPTGIEPANFEKGDGAGFRKRAGISGDSTVIGHVGRLAPEKNLGFLAEALIPALEASPGSIFLLVGDGDSRGKMLDRFKEAGLEDRVHAPGKLTGADLWDAYAAIDCFAFASQTETQGIVLAEAMAAGIPVVALDGPGVREIVRDGTNGSLLAACASAEQFSQALVEILGDPSLREKMADEARLSAREYDRVLCSDKMIECYTRLISDQPPREAPESSPWDRLVAGIEIEWELLAAKVSAVTAAVVETPATQARLD